MDCGIIGLPGVGKTTLFNAMTGADATGFSRDGLKPNIAMANVPDPRLGTIASFVTTQKIIHATIRFVDIPGIAVGGGPDGASKINVFLEHVRQVDAICHVVRCYDAPGLKPVDPKRDIEALETELILADLQVVESAMLKAEKSARANVTEAKARKAVLERIGPVLEDGLPVRSIEDWSEADLQILTGYGMMTAKKVMYVANTGEEDVTGESEAVAQVRAHAEQTGGEAVHVCAKLEAELAELDDADRDEMLESMGLSEPAIGPLARGIYCLLGLASFYTAGEKEVRAWTIRLGAMAPEAAGAIHSDLQRGFIRAECYSVNDLVELKSEKAIKEAGRLRSEGKNYAMQDGDVAHILFNV